ncbi:MAG TPA: hypothetical protein VFP15_11680, partial [Gemmatimonadaceae bacterium]|nr:hypothetical protein [Gemmatimonadaceae bacterium]
MKAAAALSISVLVFIGLKRMASPVPVRELRRAPMSRLDSVQWRAIVWLMSTEVRRLAAVLPMAFWVCSWMAMS